MTTKIKYKGSTIANLENGQKVTLHCSDKMMEGEVVVVAPTEKVVPLTATENGTYAKAYENATETWYADTEYEFQATLGGKVCNCKKATNLIVPDPITDLFRASMAITMQTNNRGEQSSELTTLESIGEAAVHSNYGIIWVKDAAVVNETFGVSNFEDNTVYITDSLFQLFNKVYDVTEIGVTAPGEQIANFMFYPVTVNVEAEDSAIPIEVATEAEMTALLTSGEVGGVYKYTGTTGTYENGALYIIEVSE